MSKYYMVYNNEYNGVVDYIGDFESLEACYENINNFNDDIEYDIYYMRVIDFKDHYMVDFGSYYRFYYITDSIDVRDRLLESLK